jgi:hypothetical protein
MAQSHDNAHPDCANRLLHQKAIEHGHHHQPTTAEIACKQAIRGQSGPDPDTGRAITELYERAMRHTALSERGSDTLPEGFSDFAAPVAFGWSACRVGLAPAGKRRLFTAHPQNGHGPPQGVAIVC